MTRFSDRKGPISLGMVGGGTDAFIGAVHRIAARMDNRYRLVAGALSSTPDRSLASGRALGLPEDRIYPDFEAMAAAEAARPDGIEAVAIVTPNHMHLPPAQAFLAQGIHVICDKPLTGTLPDARALAKAAAQSGALFVLTHNYTGYPMMRAAKAMVAAGRLGALRLVQMEYAQDWLADAAEEKGSKQAEWRTDPARSGAGGAIGDIGTHAFNLMGFVTGLSIEELSADLHRFVEGRRLDDNAQISLRLTGGARGAIWASQVATGCLNGLRMRVYGTLGALEWEQEAPEVLWFSQPGGQRQRLVRGTAAAIAAGETSSRVPAGHPEGYLEGFATIYTEAADAIVAHRSGQHTETLLPTVEDGLAGVAFVDACVRSSAANAAWTRLD